MAEKLTPQQAQAVSDRGGNLLVSAAAGSGKTKVLVDRLLSYLTDPAAPANLDDFLIITYTKAAAAELRGKIAAKLSERIAQEPGNRHLQQQVQRLYLAKISTVHSFCADLLREYAHRLDIAPDFRVGDENECRELREMAMARVLDEAYAHAADDEDFRTFLDTQGLGRDDRLVPQIVEKVYNSAQCHMDGDAWLNHCLTNTDMTGVSDAGQTVWGSYLIRDLQSYLQLQLQALRRCAAAADQLPEFAKVSALLYDTVFQLDGLMNCQTWDEIVAHKSIDFGRLTFPRKHSDQELVERIKAVRSQCKEGLEKKLRAFSDPTRQIAEDMIQVSGGTRGLIGLVRAFSDTYGRLKRRRHVLDFGDLEHRTLDLLLGKSRSAPTSIACEVGQRFREVMVDEYQDSNEVQDAIFTALTAQKQNCFMVGDVKQSIYQFRLADPGIFLKKYHSFVPAGTAQAGQGRKVLLSHNFRSGGAVLSAVNDVFRQCMSPKVGGLCYGEEEALHEGISHISLGEPEIELHAIDVQEDTYEEEAAFTAQRISALLDGTHMVRSGDTLRPIVADDIVILLRSPGSVGHHYMQALARKGISCTSGGGQDLLQTAEIMTLRSLLQTVSNPRQDIPLLSVLTSPLFGFTADELARIRSQSSSKTIYDALLQSGDEKSVAFISDLEQLRSNAMMHTLAQLLEHIFCLTHIESIYGAMEDGHRRSENLRSFYQLAVDFEATGRADLNRFLEHLALMEEKGLIASGEQGDAGHVTIMSIHRSKGLEFPVVFLCGLSRRFNREDLRAQVLCDRELGLGLSVMDSDNRVRYPTIAKRAIIAKTMGESLSEELRVLYVAMTRARDRLIMTYADQRLEAALSELTQRLDLCPGELLTGDVGCPGEWILQAALRRTEAGVLRSLAGSHCEAVASDIPWLIDIGHAAVSAATQSPCEDAVKENGVPLAQLDQIAASLAFRYPYAAATTAPSKVTATQLKGREKDEEAAQNARAVKTQTLSWRKPAFRSAAHSGRSYGNAIHAVLQYIRYEVCTDPHAVEQEVQRLLQQHYISKEQAQSVNFGQIANFFATDLGQKLRRSKNVLREFKFSILDDAANYGENLTGEQVLLQGVVDCALIEDDGITVIDFKTDYVTESSLHTVTARYSGQIQIYASALSRIYQLPVKHRLLYLFHLERFVEI